MRYTLFDNELVSPAWATVLKNMRTDGISFVVNEGHRTLARQTWFYNCMRCNCCNNGNLAAFPSPFAPHIRSGRPDHAVDFGGDVAAVMSWLSRKGLRPTRPAGAGTSRWEPWHVEVSTLALVAYAHKHSTDKWDTLPKHVEHAVRKLLYHRRQAVEEKKTGIGPKYRKHVKWRNWWRRRVAKQLRRAHKESTKRLLRQALKA